MSRIRFSFRKVLGLLFFVFLLGLGLVLLVLNARKNEVTRKLLESVNEEIHGEVTIEGVSLASIWTYPELVIRLDHIQIWDRKGDSEHRNLVLDIERGSLQADLTDLLEKKIFLPYLNLEGNVLNIEKDSAGEMIIARAFEPIVKEAQKDSGQVRIEIGSVQLNKTRILISNQLDTMAYPLDLSRVRGTFLLDQDVIKGLVDLRFEPNSLIDSLGIESFEDSLWSKGQYYLDLNKRKVQYRSQETFFNHERYRLEVDHDYEKSNVLHASILSLDQGLDLSEIFGLGRQETVIDSLGQTPVERDSLAGDQARFGLYGRGKFSGELTWRPREGKSLVQALDARFMLEGHEVRLTGLDLDALITRFKRSQNFNLVDVSAVLFAGPAGLAVTKGGDYASLAFGSKGDSTKVRHLRTSWRLKNGYLSAEDVAMSTRKNRIALAGWYQIETDSLDFNFSVLDIKGCEIVGQQVYGRVEDPDYGRVELIKTFLGPVKNFFRKIGLSKCEVVYLGEVEHPVEQNKSSKNRGKSPNSKD